jgi:serine phosphatase RsbU (regulator of sigma subunit)
MTVADVQALISTLLRDAHELTPLDLGPTLKGRLTALGFEEVSVYVADHSQHQLLPLPPAGGETLGIDSTLAGRVYQRELPAREPSDSRRLWFPVRDGIDRLGVLLLAYPSWDDALVAACESLAALVAGLLISKGQFTDDFVRAYRLCPLTLGAELCRSLLPPLSFSTRDISVAGALEPAYEVAGDSFDYALNGSSLHVAIFDGMGHDLQAARLTELMVSGFRHCRRTPMSLRDTYEYLDQLLRDVFGDDRFVTALLAVLDTDDGTLELLNAGHPGPLVVRDGRVVNLPTSHGAMPLGLGDLGTTPIPTRTVSLQPGDRVLLYTDGVTEARAPGGSLFGEDRLVDVLERARIETHVLAEAVRRLMHAVGSFHSDHWRDDATIVMVHWTPSDRMRVSDTDLPGPR